MTITDRVSTMIIGDWGYDGSGLTSSIRVRLLGDDVSNEALIAAKERATKVTEVKIDDLFNGYENGEIDYDDFLKLHQNGFRTEPLIKDVSNPSSNLSDYPTYRMYTGDYEEFVEDGLLNGRDVDPYDAEFDVVELLMFFIGFGIKNFSYDILKDDFIVGSSFGPNGSRSKTVINSFGSGLLNIG